MAVPGIRVKGSRLAAFKDVRIHTASEIIRHLQKKNKGYLMPNNYTPPTSPHPPILVSPTLRYVTA